jgi:magnesium transporter
VSTKAVLFRGDGSDETIDLAADRAYRIGNDELLWVDLEDGDEADHDALRTSLRLGDRAAGVLEKLPTESEAAVLDDVVDVVVLAPMGGLDEPPSPLRILVGRRWVVTQHAESMPYLEERREAIRDDRPVGRLTPVEFLVSLLEWHVDTFFRAAERLEAEIDELDDAALGTDRDLLQRLVRMRRRIAVVRRTLTRHRETFAELSRPDFLPDLDEHDADALAGVAGRLDRAAEAVAHTREMLIGTFDVHMTRTAQRTNDIMRILTLASVVLLPSVVLAGIMGMNFKVGLFEQPNLFWVVIGIMLVMAVGALGVARWRDWL